MNTPYIKRKWIFLVAVCCSFYLGSCKKFVDIPPPVDQVILETLFTDDQSATSAINGLYSYMMIQNFSFANSGFTLFQGLSADELLKTTPDVDISPFEDNALSAGNSNVDVNFWEKGYKHIYQANAILEGLANATELSEQVKNQLTGEAKFVRAYCYLYLTSMFGDIPLVTSTDYIENSALPRNSSQLIFDQIIQDLNDAQSLLSVDYPSAGKVRPNKWAATTLLARVYLYHKNWQLAEQNCTAVINSGLYSLTDLNNVFKADNPESIWQLMPVLTFLNTADGFGFIPYANDIIPSYVLSHWLLDAFEPDDHRKTSWIAINNVNGQDYYYPFKYQVRSGSELSEYNVVLRLAELYLMRAEARTQLNDFTNAQDDINMIRNRSGLANTTAILKDSLLVAIEHESQVEFFAEGGRRWFDLKRTGRLDPIMASEKPGWTATDTLYPIPSSELQINVHLTQNTGY